MGCAKLNTIKEDLVDLIIEERNGAYYIIDDVDAEWLNRLDSIAMCYILHRNECKSCRQEMRILRFGNSVIRRIK